MTFPLSFIVGASIPSSANTALISASICSSLICSGANSSKTANLALHSSMISVRSAGQVSIVSFVCLISFAIIVFSSASVRSSLLSICAFFNALNNIERLSFLSLSLFFIAVIISLRITSIILIVSYPPV